jgi:hypothetical protein
LTRLWVKQILASHHAFGRDQRPGGGRISNSVTGPTAGSICGNSGKDDRAVNGLARGRSEISDAIKYRRYIVAMYRN